MGKKIYRGLGVFSLILSGAVLLFYFITLLGSPYGPAFILPLLYGTVFYLLGVAGLILSFRIRLLPGIYLLVSGIVLSIVFWATGANGVLVIGAAAKAIGVASSVLLIGIGIFSIIENRGVSNKRILGLGLFALLILVLAALVFFGLYSLLPKAGESTPTVPGSLHVITRCL